MDLLIVWKDTRLWSGYIESNGQDIKNGLKYYLERNPFVSQVYWIEAKCFLEIAQETLYNPKSYFKFNRGSQATGYLTPQVQEYY